MSNVSHNLYLTYLRAPTELANIIADLEFSAKVHFFLIFLSKNISGARQNLIFKIDACELNISIQKNIFSKIFKKKTLAESKNIFFYLKKVLSPKIFPKSC